MKRYYFSCPRCGSAERFLYAEYEPSRLWWLLFLIGQFYIPRFAMVEWKTNRTQCCNCLHVFTRATLPQSPFAKSAEVIAGVLLLAAFPPLLMSWINGESWLNRLPWPEHLLALFNGDRMLAMGGLEIAMFVLAALGLVVAAMANYRYRVRFAESYRILPEDPA
jgi:hypothetical protein